MDVTTIPARGARSADTGLRRFRIYAFTLGLAAVLLALGQLMRAAQVVPRALLPTTVFAVLVALSWYYSVALFPSARLSYSLDMAYMLTAIAVLKPPLPLLTAVLGGVAGTALRQIDRDSRQRPLLPAMALNTATLVLATFAALLAAAHYRPLWSARQLSWKAVVVMALLYAAYSLTNLVVMVGAVAARGEPVFPYVAHYLRYAALLEAFSMPLALGMALLYSSSGLWGFTTLGATILVTSALLRRLNRAGSELNRLNIQLQERSRELRTLHTIGAQITSSLDPEIVFERIAANLGRIADAPHLFLSIRPRGGGAPTLEFVARDGKVLPPPDRPLGEGFTGWMVEEQRPLMVTDLVTDRDALPCAPVVLDAEVRSLLAAPLVVSGEAIGVLSVQSPRSGAYTLDHLSLLTTIAQQAAVALENARNFQLATVDQLTHLYLRDFFERKLAEETARAQRYASTFAVLVLDLDRFKDINDRLGHLAGDRFLRRVGEVIRQTMRAADTPCRWGGEEFCVLLPETDQEGARSIAERLRARIGELAMTGGGGVVRTTVSVGIACHPGDGAAGAGTLLEQADRALYAAKQAGRDRVVLAGRSAAAAAPAAPKRGAAAG
jgi:diguanylate cyclase (GGDEF)-like protein